MTRVSPHSSRKHPRYIILKASQNFSSGKSTCALIRALRSELKKKKTRKKEHNKQEICADGCSDLSLSLRNWLESDFRVYWWQKRQILKGKSRLVFRTQSAGIAKGGILMICSLCCLVRQVELTRQNELILRCVLVLIENWWH